MTADVTAPLTADVTPVTVCVGKEWYRFGSSFFLPQHARLAFVRSHFKGQLPAVRREREGREERERRERGMKRYKKRKREKREREREGVMQCDKV